MKANPNSVHGSRPMITAEEARATFDYDTETGVIRWAVDVRTGGQGDYARIKAGDIAGGISARGYRVIQFRKRFYAAHRLAWLIVHGRWPTDSIDHIDRDRLNNRLANLREASNAENQRNKAVNPKSRTGVKGVFLDPRVGRYQARICIDRKQISLGYFDTIDEAAAAYAAAAPTIHGEFANTGASNAR